MANHVLLDNISHKDLKVITTRGANWGDNISCATVFPSEFAKQINLSYFVSTLKQVNSKP